MEIFSTRTDLDMYLNGLREQNKRIGLVPTMGALHAGHIALIDFMRQHCDVLVCSIFVNPTQFNNKADLERYPRTLDQDIQMLDVAHCDVVFIPSVDEMYTHGEHWHVDLRGLDTVLEGAFRPGHFQGVTQIVKKLFDLIQPDAACFGQKDFQQVLVIKKMVQQFSMPVQIYTVPTVREPSGLAMSSRNMRLSDAGREKAAILSEILFQIPEALKKYDLEAVLARARRRFERHPGLRVEYLEICDTQYLRPLTQWREGDLAIVLVAVWIEEVRLIDNVLID